MARSEAYINHELLKWARERAGFSRDVVARKIGVNFSVERLDEWEAGDKRPTFNQLQKLAKNYHQSISFFYLPHPPQHKAQITDFRHIFKGARAPSPRLKLEIYDTVRRRELALDLLSDIGEEVKPFNLDATLTDEPEDIALSVRRHLDISYDDQKSWRDKDGYKAFNSWRKKIEAIGVLVFQMSGIDNIEARGFSISEQYMPVISVNRKDRPRGRVFSLLHELAHLVLRQGGVCNFDEGDNGQEIEVFCNHLSAATLLPKAEFLEDPIVQEHKNGLQWSDEEIETLSRQSGGASEEVILRRLLTLEMTTNKFYREKREEYVRRYVAIMERERSKRESKKTEYKRDVSKEQISALGKNFIRIILDNYHEKRITLADAANYLDVSPKYIPKIEERMAK